MSPGRSLFVSGAAVSMTMSFDVPRHRHVPIELYGETGSLIVPDPNYFGGKVEFATADEDWREIPTRARLCRRQLPHPRRSPTWRRRSASGRPHRASGELAFHVLEVMEAFQTSSDSGRR